MQATERIKSRKEVVQMPSAKSVAPETLVKSATAEERTDLSEQWLELSRVTQRTAIDTVRKFLETAESMPLLGTGLSITERLAHMEYDALRSIVHSAADVDVNVGVNVDVLSKGVNLNVLSREATP
jgi:hypothetical protein